MSYHDHLPTLPALKQRANLDTFLIAGTAAATDVSCSGWSYPRPEVFDLGESFEIRLGISGLETESVVIEAAEDLLALSGRRKEHSSGEGELRVLPFRRLIDLPDPVKPGTWMVSYFRDTLFLLSPGKRFSNRWK